MTGRPASDARPRGSLRRSGPLPPLPRHGSARRMVAALPCRRRPPPSATARPFGPRALCARLVRENGKTSPRQHDHLHHLVTEARLVPSWLSCGGAGQADLGLKLARLMPVWRLRSLGDAFGPGSPLQLPLADAPGNFRCDPYRLRSLALPARSACPWRVRGAGRPPHLASDVVSLSL